MKYKAIFTETGMRIYPFSPTKMGMILNARSIWIPGGHTRVPVTAYVIKDATTGLKNLVTYKCHPKWLQEQIPEVEIEYLLPLH